MTYHSESICDPIEFDWEAHEENQEEAFSEEVEKENEPKTKIILLNDLVEFPICDDIKSIEIKIFRHGQKATNQWSATYHNELPNNSDFNCAYEGIRYFLGKYFYSKMTHETVWSEACNTLESAFGIIADIFTNAINCHLYKTEITLTLYDNNKIVYEL